MLQRLQHLIATYLPSLIASYAAAGRAFPSFLRRELDLFFTCGEPAYGFAQAGCSSCGYVRVIYFSCKRRSLCWRCIGRRRDECVPQLMRHILPHTDMRQWVLTLPTELRIHLRYHPSILSAVRRFFIRAIRRHLRMRAKKALGLTTTRLAHTGAVSVIHLTSASLAANVHVHAVVPNGVFLEDPVTGCITFHELPGPSADDLAGVALRVCQQTVAHLRRNNLWTDAVEPVGPSVVRGTITLGHPRTVTYAAMADQPGQPQLGEAFQVWVGDPIHRMNRVALKNLMLYLLSPAFTESQLTIREDDTVELRLKRPRRDGTTTVTFTPHEFIEAVKGLIRSPRSHSLEYHGVLGRNSRIRHQVLPDGAPAPAPRPVQTDLESLRYREACVTLFRRAHSKVLDWCPACSKRLILVALVTTTMRYSNPRWRHPDTPRLPAAMPVPRHATMGANCNRNEEGTRKHANNWT